MIGAVGLKTLQVRMLRAMTRCHSPGDSGAKVGGEPKLKTTLGAVCRLAMPWGQSAPQRTGTGRQMTWRSAVTQGLGSTIIVGAVIGRAVL